LFAADRTTYIKVGTGTKKHVLIKLPQDNVLKIVSLLCTAIDRKVGKKIKRVGLACLFETKHY